jgi:hypothetical protein
MPNSDYIPRIDREFNDFFHTLYLYVSQKTDGNNPEWTFIPDDDLERFADAWDSWSDAWQATLQPHTPIDTERKTEIRKLVEKEIREFVNHFLRYEPVTNEDRTAMGIHNPKDSRSPIPVPKTAPNLLPNTATRRRLTIEYNDEGSEHRGKPAFVHGLELRWAILDKPPQDIEELVHSSFSTQSPLILEFPEYDRGKHVYMVGRWEIERGGEKGPFGAIEEAIVP